MKTDTKISGSGKIGQGEYNLIKISGSGAIEGPVTFETFKVSGSCKVCPDATLEGNEMHISGSIHSQSEIKVNTLHVSGSLHSENDMKSVLSKPVVPATCRGKFMQMKFMFLVL